MWWVWQFIDLKLCSCTSWTKLWYNFRSQCHSTESLDNCRDTACCDILMSVCLTRRYDFVSLDHCEQSCQWISTRCICWESTVLKYILLCQWVSQLFFNLIDILLVYVQTPVYRRVCISQCSVADIENPMVPSLQASRETVLSLIAACKYDDKGFPQEICESYLNIYSTSGNIGGHARKKLSTQSNSARKPKQITVWHGMVWYDSIAQVRMCRSSTSRMTDK